METKLPSCSLNLLKPWQLQNRFPSLVSQEGREVTAWEDMAQLIEVFLEKTLGGTMEGTTPTEQAAFQDQVLASISD